MDILGGLIEGANNLKDAVDRIGDASRGWNAGGAILQTGRELEKVGDIFNQAKSIVGTRLMQTGIVPTAIDRFHQSNIVNFLQTLFGVAADRYQATGVLPWAQEGLVDLGTASLNKAQRLASLNGTFNYSVNPQQSLINLHLLNEVRHIAFPEKKKEAKETRPEG